MLFNHQQAWIKCRKKNKFGSCVPCESWKLQDDRTWKQGSWTKTTKLWFKHLVTRRNPNQNLSKIYSDLLEIKFGLPKKKSVPFQWSLFVFGYLLTSPSSTTNQYHQFPTFNNRGALLKSKPLDAKLVHTITSLPLQKSAKKKTILQQIWRWKVVMFSPGTWKSMEQIVVLFLRFGVVFRKSKT